MNGLDVNRLGTWVRKILRIHGLVAQQGMWRIKVIKN
jgi:hypothetical protein